MTEAERIAERINSARPRLKGGTLRFWGEWFGKPYDNFHQIVGCEAAGDTLRFYFDEGEVLCVWSPQSCVADEGRFSIRDAERVRWEWFYYGRPKTPENRYFEDFRRTPERIEATTNTDWYTPNFKPSGDFPAVEML